jgi:hypothetical protein
MNTVFQHHAKKTNLILCMLNIGMPQSTVRIPERVAMIGPMVDPQPESELILCAHANLSYNTFKCIYIFDLNATVVISNVS